MSLFVRSYPYVGNAHKVPGTVLGSGVSELDDGKGVPGQTYYAHVPFLLPPHPGAGPGAAPHCLGSGCGLSGRYLGQHGW